MKETQVVINASVIEDGAREQIEAIKNHPAIRGLISIMPDVHQGAGCVIGFTGKFRNAVIPNIVGVDIGCGVCAYPLDDDEIDYAKFDEHAREAVPLGFNSHRDTKPLMRTSDETMGAALSLSIIAHDWFTANNVKISTDPKLQLGTLGGGNHFVEIDEDADGKRYVTVHSGSRNFGLKVALHYQKMAKRLCEGMMVDVPKDMEYLPMEFGGSEYKHAMVIAQEYAHVNRVCMIESLLKHFDIEFEKNKMIESVHNYWSFKDGVVRKGAISAHDGEQVVIPLNMAEGIILGTGKGISSYNHSAPHGAGRVSGRKAMQRKLQAGEVTMEAFQERMKGVYSTCVDAKHIDESPFAYKSFDSIEEELKATVDVKSMLKPVYNLKG